MSYSFANSRDTYTLFCLITTRSYYLQICYTRACVCRVGVLLLCVLIKHPKRIMHMTTLQMEQVDSWQFKYISDMPLLLHGRVYQCLEQLNLSNLINSFGRYCCCCCYYYYCYHYCYCYHYHNYYHYHYYHHYYYHHHHIFLIITIILLSLSS